MTAAKDRGGTCPSDAGTGPSLDSPSGTTAAPIRDEKRRALFWKQIERAAADVAAWPDYLKRAFGVTVLPRNLTHCATCDRPFPESMTHWDDYFVDIEDAGFVCEACPEVFDD